MSRGRQRFGEIKLTQNTTKHLFLDEWSEAVGILEDIEKRKNTISFMIVAKYGRFLLTVARSELKMTDIDNCRCNKKEKVRISILRTNAGHRVLTEPA